MPIANRLYAEFLGTFWLVLGGCGSAVLAAGFPELGIGFARRRARLRPHRAHHGLCRRPHLRRPLQSGGDGRARGRRPLPRPARSCPTSSPRSWAAIVGAARALCDRQRQGRLRRRRRLRLQRLRRALAGRLLAGRRAASCEVVHDLLLPDGHPRRHRPARARRASRRIAIGLALTLIHLDQHPGHQHLGEPGAQHRAGAVRRRLGAGAALAVLGGADRRRALSAASPTSCSPLARTDGAPTGR